MINFEENNNQEESKKLPFFAYRAIHKAFQGPMDIMINALVRRLSKQRGNEGLDVSLALIISHIILGKYTHPEIADRIEKMKQFGLEINELLKQLPTDEAKMELLTTEDYDDYNFGDDEEVNDEIEDESDEDEDNKDMADFLSQAMKEEVNDDSDKISDPILDEFTEEESESILNLYLNLNNEEKEDK